MDLKNKVFIVTGAARIGVDVVNALKARGGLVAVSYLNTEPAVGDLKVKADVSQAGDVAGLVAATKKQFGRLDGVIHMAAIYPRTPWATVSEADWDKNMNVIAKSAFLLAKAAAAEMTTGKMIFISDWSVLTQPYKDYLPYNVAKTAIDGLTKSLAKELAPHISVNAIAPGPILKPADLSDEDNAEVMKNTPLERWGGAEEITKAVLFFLESDFTTGQILAVDGGRSIA